MLSPGASGEAATQVTSKNPQVDHPLHFLTEDGIYSLSEIGRLFVEAGHFFSRVDAFIVHYAATSQTDATRHRDEVISTFRTLSAVVERIGAPKKIEAGREPLDTLGAETRQNIRQRMIEIMGNLFTVVATTNDTDLMKQARCFLLVGQGIIRRPREAKIPTP